MSQLQSSVSSREGQPYLGGRANSALGGAQFEAFEVNFLNRELRKDGIPVKLPEKPLQVLEALLAKAGDMVRREELREKLWPDTHVAFDRSINTAVTQLRRALDDPVNNPPLHRDTIPAGVSLFRVSQDVGCGGATNLQGRCDHRYHCRPAL